MDFGDGNGAFGRTPTHTYDGVSSYQATVNVITDIGCTDADEMDIYGDVIFYIPGVYSGQRWLTMCSHSMVDRSKNRNLIYNRWGQ